MARIRRMQEPFNKQDCEYALSWAKKIMAIRELGGKCIVCGTDDFVVLTFHHHNGEKESCITTMLDLRWSEIKKELSKCVLLCRNCHREKHHADRKKDYFCGKLKAKLLQIKGTDRCIKCSYRGDALDFHHHGEKKFNISSASSQGYKLEQIILEIDQCQVLCGNCHLHEHFDAKRFERLRALIDHKINTHIELPPPINKEMVLELISHGLSRKEIEQKTGYSASTISRCLVPPSLDVLT